MITEIMDYFATYSTSNLNLVVDTAPIRVMVRLALRPSTETREIDRSCVLVDLHVLWPLRLWLFEDRRGDLAQPLTGVPNFENDIENASVDFPRRRAEYVETCVDEFDVANTGGVLEVCLLFLGLLEPHDDG